MRQYSKLVRLYVPDDLANRLDCGSDCELPQSQAHYLGIVMRLNTGAQIRVFNGENGEFLAELTDIAKRRATIKIIEQLRAPKSAPDIWLLFAPVKKHRNTFIVEKATELGAALIRPVITARTTSKIRTDKIAVQIIEAAEQTERLDLPLVREPVKLDKLLSDWDDTRTLIFADEAIAGGECDAPSAAKNLAKIKAPAAILIGPEGGFSQGERDMLRAKAYCTPISLGPRILRADTAVAATLALWQSVSGDW